MGEYKDDFQAECVRLRYHGKSMREIGRELGCSHTKVWRALSNSGIPTSAKSVSFNRSLYSDYKDLATPWLEKIGLPFPDEQFYGSKYRFPEIPFSALTSQEQNAND